MSLVPFNTASANDAAGRGWLALEQNAARAAWGLFRRPQGIATTSGADTTLFGRLCSTFTNALTGGSQALFPMASPEEIGVDFTWALPSAPQENGSVVTYNKVRNPGTATITYVCDGSQSGTSALETLLPDMPFSAAGQSNRTAFINAVEEAAASLELYELRTPEGQWSTVNIVGWRKKRNLASYAMLAVEISLQEVRTTATRTYTNTRHPAGAAVQPQGAATQLQGAAAPSLAPTLLAPG
ncbi:hypothetical protein E3E12_07975 [Formicincola oecophyllae]|uniref:Dit-like phage tail protein N-terminal domain-containing protein n=1 Tax=Formicincola oecophyllae TaxID=2558361 RepID=A0A4Y6U9I3_9PROT|nr:hypothetical protein [Formicincola oecophyllae]QDH14133.1 hypothetical protein E3E12_07975 [Formicincola oecophyllae]